MTARKKPPQEVPNDNVVTDESLHERRVTELIKKGVADMKSGKSPFFPMHKLIEVETNRMQAEIDAYERKRKPKRRQKKIAKKGH